MEEDVIKKNNYALGIIGALVGAFVGAIPWILAYVYGNVMYGVLAILIAIGSYYGYKITKSTMDKKLPIILSVCSFISITVTMFIIIPLCLLAREELGVSFTNLLELYQYKEFMWAILRDYGIALIFCIAVISGIISNLYRQLKNGVDAQNIKILSNPYESMFTSEDIEKAGQIFEKNDAVDKYHTITKDLIIEELAREFGQGKAEQIFDYLRNLGIVKRKSNKYYFSSKNYDRYSRGARPKIAITIILIVIIIFIMFVAVLIAIQESDNSNSDNNLYDTNTSLSDNSYNQDETYLTNNTYETNISDITIEVPQDLITFSGTDLMDYFGEDIYYYYDWIAMDQTGDTIIAVFTIEKDDMNQDYTAEQYLQSTFEEENVQIQQTQIGENTFYMYEQSLYDNQYTEIACVYDGGDQFLCLDIYSPSNDKIELSDVIK